MCRALFLCRALYCAEHCSCAELDAFPEVASQGLSFGHLHPFFTPCAQLSSSPPVHNFLHPCAQLSSHPVHNFLSPLQPVTSLLSEPGPLNYSARMPTSLTTLYGQGVIRTSCSALLRTALPSSSLALSAPQRAELPPSVHPLSPLQGVASSGPQSCNGRTCSA